MAAYYVKTVMQSSWPFSVVQAEVGFNQSCNALREKEFDMFNIFCGRLFGRTINVCLPFFEVSLSPCEYCNAAKLPHSKFASHIFVFFVSFNLYCTWTSRFGPMSFLRNSVKIDHRLTMMDRRKRHSQFAERLSTNTNGPLERNHLDNEINHWW